jgi:hypothetical protein
VITGIAKQYKRLSINVLRTAGINLLCDVVQDTGCALARVVVIFQGGEMSSFNKNSAKDEIPRGARYPDWVGTERQARLIR